jgi:hypothetical protein
VEELCATHTDEILWRGELEEAGTTGDYDREEKKTYSTLHRASSFCYEIRKCIYRGKVI